MITLEAYYSFDACLKFPFKVNKLSVRAPHKLSTGRNRNVRLKSFSRKVKHKNYVL